MSATRTAKSLLIALMLTCLPGPHAAAVTNNDQTRPHPVRDLRYGVALFDFYQNHYFDAITDIMVAQQRAPISNQGNDPELLLGSLYLSYGMHEAAADIFQRLLDSAITPYTHDLAWFYLGQLRYRDGQFANALTALDAVGTALPTVKDGERLHLIVNAQLHEKKYDEALKTLERLKHDGIWNDFARYNLGTALIRVNRAKEGIELLNKVGLMEPRDEEEYALRDKANIAIGFASLHDSSLADPVASFSRVRLNGPFSTQALLGIGWAHNAQNRPKEALIPWIELGARPADLASQEALVAIAYTLEKLGAPEMALTYYQSAIATYDHERATLDTALSATHYAELLRASVPASTEVDAERLGLAVQFPELPAARYLYDILASAEFQKAYRDYRDLRYLKAQVIRWQDKLPFMQTMLEERRRHYALNLTQIGASDFVGRLGTINAQRATLMAKIADIEGEEKVGELADNKEHETNQQLLEIKSKLNGLSSRGIDVTGEMRKFRILYGLMQWRLRTEYPQRLWGVKRELRALDHDLEQTSSLQLSLETILKITPLNFDGFAERISDLDLYLTNLSQKLDGSIDKHERVCTSLITDALNARKRQIEAYRNRALYAQARLYDQLSHNPNTP